MLSKERKTGDEVKREVEGRIRRALGRRVPFGVVETRADLSRDTGLGAAYPAFRHAHTLGDKLFEKVIMQPSKTV